MNRIAVIDPAVKDGFREALAARLGTGWEVVREPEGASVIVVGRRGEPGALAALVGSVPRRLAQHARRPVLIVPTG